MRGAIDAVTGGRLGRPFAQRKTFLFRFLEACEALPDTKIAILLLRHLFHESSLIPVAGHGLGDFGWNEQGRVCR